MTTEEQQKVIDFDKGGLLVIAAAGSGKTYSLKERFKNLISKGVAPERILCITFTNKAGEEMRSRVATATNIDPSKLSIYTFHGFCNYWLRKEGGQIGIHNYTIIDEEITSSIIKAIVNKNVIRQKDYANYSAGHPGNPEQIKADYLEKENEIYKKMKYNIVRSAISDAANKNTTVKLVAKSNYKDFIVTCAKAYEDFKVARRYLDFNDLEIYGINLFKVFEVNKHYDYVMIDEIQDSSEVDLALLKIINISNIMGVGDLRQSIYGFRGASTNNTETFVKLFNAETLYLNTNFRSDTSIVDVANSTIAHLGYPKMVANTTSKGLVVLADFATEEEQIESILTTIKNFT